MIVEIVTTCIGLAAVAHGCGLIPDSPVYPDPVELFAPRVEWDKHTLVRISPKELPRAGYPRITELKDGALLCVFEGAGSVFAVRSENRGVSWDNPKPVAWKQTGINMAAPDVIQLQDGSILATYNPRPYRISGKRNFGIRTRKSYDGGRTWIHGRLLYEAGHKFTDGCWEPAPIQWPDGEIWVFFADEAPFADQTSDDQHIAILKSKDSGLTWSRLPQVISYKERGRDGMPVPLILQGSGEMVCAIEQTVGGHRLQPGIIRVGSKRLRNPITSTSVYRETPLAGKIGPKIYGGAPGLRQLSTGETLLSYQGTEGRINRLHRANMKVWVGDKNARNFRGYTVPFDIPADRFALWSSLTVLKDDTIIAVTSTNAFSDTSEVWMIKGRLQAGPVQKYLKRAQFSAVSRTMSPARPGF